MDFTKLKNCLDEILAESNTPSVDCIVYKNHEKVFRHFAGLSDIESNKAVCGNELYFIFSMTKMLTCTAALQLFEQGAFSMEDELSKFLPEFERMKVTSGELDAEAAAKITTGASLGESSTADENGYAKNPIKIIDLFTMRAGFDYNLSDDSIKNALASGKTSTLDLAKALSHEVLGFEPGTRFRYSLCHDILGALIEIWSGKKLGDYMAENIFEPLGMSSTFFPVPNDKETLSRIATRYTCDENNHLQKLTCECIFNLSVDYQSGGAGLISCTEDYAIFLDALSCGGVGKNGYRILSEKTVNLMKTNYLCGQALEDFHKLRKGYGYGLGVRTHIDKTQSGSLSPIGEFGWDGAAGAFSMVDTDNKISLTYFQHCHNWDLAMQTKIRNALYSCLT